ncbi:MAG: hypothetical protein ACYSSI_06170, partial [Planctomycetota bacterium]
KLYAVCIQKTNEGFKILWKKNCDIDKSNWYTFAEECGLYVANKVSAPTERQNIIAGFDTEGVAFYKFDIPTVRKDELASIVKLQAEARMPLPAERIEFCWKVGSKNETGINITIAAGRKEQLQEFAGKISLFKPGKILLDCEGLVAVWKEIFGGGDKQAVVVNMRQRNAQICLVEKGQLCNVASLDIGLKDLDTYELEPTEVIERFAFDLQSVLEMFGCSEGEEIKVFVLSDGSDLIEQVVSQLKTAGIEAHTVLPNIDRFADNTEVNVEDVYEYRAAIGLGIRAIDGEAEGLNLFENLYRPKDKEEKKDWLHSSKITCVAAVVMLVLTVLVSYWMDIISEGRINKLLMEKQSSRLVERQKLIKEVALRRPDILGLLEEINSGDAKGIMLNGFKFKKGKPVIVYGEAPDAEKMYEFQKNLLNKKGITQVKIQNTEKSKKGGKLKFTMGFHYRNYTKKGR